MKNENDWSDPEGSRISFIENRIFALFAVREGFRLSIGKGEFESRIERKDEFSNSQISDFGSEKQYRPVNHAAIL